MGTLSYGDHTIDYQWATDVNFEGLRLEVWTSDENMLFDVSVADGGTITVNTFDKEVAAELMLAALDLARSRR